MPHHVNTTQGSGQLDSWAALTQVVPMHVMPGTHCASLQFPAVVAKHRDTESAQ
jgi:hypothetical protein